MILHYLPKTHIVKKKKDFSEVVNKIKITGICFTRKYCFYTVNCLSTILNVVWNFVLRTHLVFYLTRSDGSLVVFPIVSRFRQKRLLNECSLHVIICTKCTTSKQNCMQSRRRRRKQHLTLLLKTLYHHIYIRNGV